MGFSDTGGHYAGKSGVQSHTRLEPSDSQGQKRGFTNLGWGPGGLRQVPGGPGTPEVMHKLGFMCS